MFFYILASCVVAFVAGYLSSRIPSKRTIDDLNRSTVDAVESAWHEGWAAGWHGASTDLTTVKAAYEKIFGARK